MRYLIQMTLFDNKVNKEDLLEKLCGSSIDYSNDKNNTFIQKNRICKSSGFGSVILYPVEEGLTDKFDYELNRLQYIQAIKDDKRTWIEADLFTDRSSCS